MSDLATPGEPQRPLEFRHLMALQSPNPPAMPAPSAEAEAGPEPEPEIEAEV